MVNSLLVLGPDVHVLLFCMQAWNACPPAEDSLACVLAMQIGIHDGMHFKVAGYVSKLTYIGRRTVLILFINGRPVEQGQLKRAMEALYVAQVGSGQGWVDIVGPRGGE